MDQNFNNENRSSDPFYSYQNGAQGYYRDPNQGQAAGYGAAGTGYGSAAQPQQEPKKKEKKQKRDRGGSGGFGVKLAKCAAFAVTFGLISGLVFEGVHVASEKLFSDGVQAEDSDGNVLTQANADSRLETTSTSQTYIGADVSDMVDEVMPSIVAITNVSEQEYRSFWGGREMYESTSCGSGIIVSQDDDYLYIVTNNHVVEGANSLTVAFADNSTVSAEVKGTDPSTDLAVIKVERDSIEEEAMQHIKIATLGDSDALRVGEMSVAIGNALGYGQSVTVGYISALDREVSIADSESGTDYTAELIQTDAAINPGNSGGALLNAHGEVIGINSVKYSDTSVEGIGYAIPISTAMPIIEDLITKEKVDESDSAWIGIAGVDVTSDVARAYGMPTGVFVAQVTKGSAAESAGLRYGDIITAFDGKAISSMEELSTRLQYYKAGETVDVTIQRIAGETYEEQNVSVTLGKKN